MVDAQKNVLVSEMCDKGLLKQWKQSGEPDEGSSANQVWYKICFSI